MQYATLHLLRPNIHSFCLSKTTAGDFSHCSIYTELCIVLDDLLFECNHSTLVIQL